MQRSDPRHLPSGVELLAATTTRPFPLGVPGGRRSLPLPPLVCVIAEIAGGCACILCFPITPQRARAPRGRVPARAGSIFYTQAGRENQLSQGAPGPARHRCWCQNICPGCSSPPLHCPTPEFISSGKAEGLRCAQK